MKSVNNLRIITYKQLFFFSFYWCIFQYDYECYMGYYGYTGQTMAWAGVYTGKKCIIDRYECICMRECIQVGYNYVYVLLSLCIRNAFGGV